MGEPAAVAPRIVGRYEIFEEIASGGMATVYLGRLLGSGGFSRTVAIKRLHPQFAKDPEFVTMFLDEARLAARIRHPNVVPTLDVVAARGELFLVLEYVQGESLSRLMRVLRARGDRVPISIAVRVMSDVLQGLHAAHEARDERGVPLGIVHRDVTPQNILVGSDGVSRLLDFGVAKAKGRSQTTQEGQIKGKLAYMAPEQLMSSGVTRETDLYAASVVLWEMLTGQRLIHGDSDVDVVASLLRRDIQVPSSIAAEIPPELDDLVMRGLAARADDRFPTAREMAAALAECGLPEAPSVAVGEWVEELAPESLAERTAKMAAVDSHPEPFADSSSSSHARALLADAATVVESEARARDRTIQDTPSRLLGLTIQPDAPRRAGRGRLLGVAVIATLVAIGAIAGAARTVRLRPTMQGVALPPAAPSVVILPAPVPPPAPSVAPPPPSHANEPPELSVAALPAAADSAPPRDTRRAPSRRSGAVRTRPSAGGHAQESGDHVFETRQ